MPSADQDIVERLKQLDTPSVSDALDSLGLFGRITHLKRLATEQRIAGRVLTTKLGTAAPLGTLGAHRVSASPSIAPVSLSSVAASPPPVGPFPGEPEQAAKLRVGPRKTTIKAN